MSNAKRPLEGLKVLDFTRVYSGPYCTMMFGDLGAEIIKVERKGSGDDTHDFQPVKDGESGYFTYLNRNKKSISLDLKKQEAKEIIYRLAKEVDIVIENFSPGVVDRLGIGYEDLAKINPSIIYGSISGFGQTGPYKSKPAYDVVCQAMGGFMDLTGDADGKPYKLGPSIVDASAGIHMAYAVLAAVYYREKTGEGQFIDVGMMDTAFSTLENFVVTATLTGKTPTRNGNANLGSAPFNTFKTKTGYVTIACANNKLFKNLVTVMEKKELLEDPRFTTNSLRKHNEGILNQIVEEWTMEHTVEEVTNLLDAASVPVGPILTVDELLVDPHLKERDMIVEIDHPILGPIKYPGNPLKFSKTKADVFDPAPTIGQHTDEILKELCKYDDKEVEDIKSNGIV